MIHAVVFKDQEDRIRGFELCGHAEYAQPGQDVVCAAVSMLAINTANSIECLTEDRFSMTADDEKGEIHVVGHHRKVGLISDTLKKRLLDNGISNKELAEFMDAPKEVD